MSRSNRSQRLAFNVAFSGIVSAISVIIMFGSLIPSFAYAVPALAGLTVWTVSEHISLKWAYICFGAVSLISFMLVPELEADFFFLFFLGYYPTLCETLDKIKNKVIRFIVKLGIFNAAVVAVYNVLVILLSTEEMLEGLEELGQYALLVLWAGGNIAFIIYDPCIRTIKQAYIKLIKPKIVNKIK